MGRFWPWEEGGEGGKTDVVCETVGRFCGGLRGRSDILFGSDEDALRVLELFLCVVGGSLGRAKVAYCFWLKLSNRGGKGEKGGRWG